MAARGVVLERTTGATLIGNVFDGVGDGVVGDAAAIDARLSGNIFLSARGWYVDAPDLNAGGNYWATPDARTAESRVRGRVSVLPWRSAREAGY